MSRIIDNIKAGVEGLSNVSATAAIIKERVAPSVGPRVPFTPDLASDHPEQFKPYQNRTHYPEPVKVPHELAQTIGTTPPPLRNETCEMRRAREYGIDLVPTEQIEEKVYLTEEDPTAHWARTSNDALNHVHREPNRGADMQAQRADLAMLLHEAADAHHVYESTLPEPDQFWFDWYANYLLTRGVRIHPEEI